MGLGTRITPAITNPEQDHELFALAFRHSSFDYLAGTRQQAAGTFCLYIW